MTNIVSGLRRIAEEGYRFAGDAADEIERLRAKIAEMEQQEPVAWMLNCQTLGGDTGWILSWTQSGAGLCDRLPGTENEKKLYALPGAQPAPSVRDGWKLVPIEPTEDMLRAMTDPFVAINGDNRKAFESAYTAMLAAAPKPEATP